MRWNTIILIILFVSISTENISFAQPLIQKLDEFSVVDWQRLVIRTTGNSAFKTNPDNREHKIQALEKARIAAENNLFDAVKALTLDSHTTVNDLIQAEKISVNNLMHLVRQFTIVDTRSMSDMSVELDIEFPITGPLFALLTQSKSTSGKLQLSNQPLCPTCWQPWPHKKAIPDGIKLVIPAEGFLAGNNKPFTGLLIDARGINLRPAILPKIINLQNEEIYSVHYVEREIAVKSGIVVYKHGLAQALKDSRTGARPLVIRALQTAGSFNSDILVSNSDALIIHAAAKMNNFLRNGAVIIVQD